MSQTVSEIQIYTDVAQLAWKIDEFERRIAGLQMPSVAGICGFDGFIDSFIQMQNPATMDVFGDKVKAAAGIAASYPVHRLEEKFGGNGPLLSVALHDIFSGKIDISYIGALGQEKVLPIFHRALNGKMRNIYSLAEPAHSDCIEFKDGKIMLSDMRACGDVSWERLLECIGLERMDEMLRECRFIAAVNWGKLVNVGGIWKNIARRLGTLGVAKKEVVFLMDLAEFEQRPSQDRLDLLELIEEITAQCHTILSLNLKEAWQMARELNGDFYGKKTPQDVAELALFLKTAIDADRIIVHPNDGAACASRDGVFYISGPFCKEPLISTGAGDNFGAGCLAGVLCGMDDEGILLSGVCASGHFVRSGRSPSYPEIGRLASLWAEGRLPERL